VVEVVGDVVGLHLLGPPAWDVCLIEAGQWVAEELPDEPGGLEVRLPQGVDGAAGPDAGAALNALLLVDERLLPRYDCLDGAVDGALQSSD